MSHPSAVLAALWIKPAKRAPMEPAQSASLIAERGIKGDANLDRPRQITIIEAEKFELLSTELGAHIEPIWRRANLMVRGLSLTDAEDQVLRIGDARLRVAGVTHGCGRMDEAFQGLRAAMKENTAAGIYADVLEDGEIRVGDEVRWEG